MIKPDQAYILMNEGTKPPKLSVSDIIKKAKSELDSRGDTDYSDDSEVFDLIGNYDKSEILGLLIIVAQMYSAQT